MTVRERFSITHSIAPTTPAPAPGIVLVVYDDADRRQTVAGALRDTGYHVLEAVDGLEALTRIADTLPDLVLCAVPLPVLDGVEMLLKVRADARTSAVAFVFSTSGADTETETIARAFEAGADDYIGPHAGVAEIVARVRGKIERPPVPLDQWQHDRRTGLATEAAFVGQCDYELAHAEREFLPIAFATIEIPELAEIRERYGERDYAVIARELAALLNEHFGAVARLGQDDEGRFLVLMQTTRTLIRERLNTFCRAVNERRFRTGSAEVVLTPVAGFAPRTGTDSQYEMRRRAAVALAAAAEALDLQAVGYDARLEDGTRRRSVR